MTPYALVRLIHVAVSVLGLGSITAIAVAAHHARRHPAALAATPVAPLARWATISVAAMLVTGVALDLLSHGVLHELFWFRASAISLLVTGALLGLLRRTVRGAGDGPASDRALARVWRLAIAACAVVLWIVVLMEIRPALSS